MYEFYSSNPLLLNSVVIALLAMMIVAWTVSFDRSIRADMLEPTGQEAVRHSQQESTLLLNRSWDGEDDDIEPLQDRQRVQALNRFWDGY